MQTADPNHSAQKAHAARRSAVRKVGMALLVNLFLVAVMGLLGEAGMRTLWRPRFWVHCDNLFIGSGRGEAGRKWWPNARYQIESQEFRVRYRTNGLGYRRRPSAPRTPTPYRIAFVGDSFTEAVQVEYDESFVSRLEAGLNAQSLGREIVADNFGVAGTGFFEYWHRIVHDVFRPDVPAPDAVVVCIYPGNDFIDPCPNDGFEPDGQPKRTYFRRPTWSQHALAWLDLKSKLGHFVLQSLKLGAMRFAAEWPEGPAFWWSDPAAATAARDASGIRHIRALMRAIEDECDGHGTRLVILVVGPVNDYAVHGGPSPLAQIMSAWGIKAPVIDVAARANALAAPGKLVYFHDGHLNPKGHRFLADTAQEPLAQALGLTRHDDSMPGAGVAISRADHRSSLPRERR